MARMKVATYLTRALEQEGVRFAFGIHGSALSHLIDQVTHDSGIVPILTRHEEGAAFMADGYARFSRTLGVCWGTSGPGTTNLLTGLATSLVDAVPVLAIGGQVPTGNFHRGAFQESTSTGVDSVALLRSVTKFAEMVQTPAQVPVLLKRALRAALTGRRGPTALVIPRDCMVAEIEGPPPPVFSYRVGNRCYDSRMVGRAAKLLAASARPMILAGTGISMSNANRELVNLAESLGSAVATTPKAKGCFPEDHPLSLGVLGLGGNPSASRFLIEEADLLLAVGTSLGQIETLDFHPRFEKLQLLHADIDPEEIGKNFPVEVGLVGDAQVILRELSVALHYLDSPGPKPTRLAALETFGKRVPRTIDAHLADSDAVPILPQRAIVELRRILPRDAVVFWDSGNHNLWGVHYFAAYEPRTFTFSPNFGAMGYGVAACIGAKLALPERVVVSVCGDGGFLMNGTEVSVAAEYGLHVIWVVLDNHALGMVHQGDRANLGRASGGLIRTADIAGMARGLGAHATRVRDAASLRDRMREALDRPGPSVVVVDIDPEQIPPIPMLRPELREPR